MPNDGDRADTEGRRERDGAPGTSGPFSEDPAEFAHVIHELKTPLNELIHLARLAAAAEDPDDRRRYLEILMHSASDLAELLNHLLGRSREEPGEERSRKAQVPLGRFMERTLGPLRVLAQLKDLYLRWELGAGVPAAVLFDPIKVAQVLRNLAGNGIKYTSRGGVFVSAGLAETQSTPSRLAFVVQDTGAGIDRDRIEEAFLPFRRNLHTNGNLFAPQGSGLGLSVVKRIIDDLKGTITYDGGPERGSVFRFEVPCEFPPACPDTDITRVRTETGRGRIQAEEKDKPAGGVLLVEDNAISRIYIRHCLETGGGFTVDTAENGADAVRLCGEKSFHLIVMDLHMPVMDGFEAARLIRNTPRTGKKIPMIALSAYVSQKDYERALEAGFDEVMVKPVHAETLISRVEELLAMDYLCRALPQNLCTGMDITPEKSGFDLTAFQEKYRGSEDVAGQILALFLEDVPVKIDALHRARADRDGGMCGRLAHSLANAFGTLCALRALRLAREIEAGSGEGEDVKVGRLIEELRTEEKKIREGILEYIDSMKT
jgi:CheY-like chemotaxis protein/HPt (histidine-containing phosphotransfer) domain-containing protein